MSVRAAEQKALMRERIRSQVQCLPIASREVASKHLCSRVRSISAWSIAETLLFYVPLGDELDIRALICESLLAGKVVAIPRFDPVQQGYEACSVINMDKDLTIGRFGVMEPRAGCPTVPLNRLDFITVPGIAFAFDGRRLGRGKGYYDRLLASASGTKCGVAFDEQIVASIPVEAHDVQLDWIVTPTRSVRVSEGASRF